MRSSKSLFALAAVIAMTSTGCFSTRTVFAIRTPPNACITPCQKPLPPLKAADNRERTEQEQRAMFERDACIALHNECVAKSVERMQRKQ